MYRNVHRGERGARLLVLGEGPLASLQVADSGRLFELSPERQSLADAVCDEMRERGLVITADPVYRLQSWTVGERFVLQVDRGDYSQVVGCKTHPEWEVKARVLAVCCVLECPDGFVIERRSARVAALPGMWHIAPSGSLQPPTTPLATLLQEASEELALDASEVLDSRCVGMLYGEDSGVFQLACSARTDVTLDEMVARKRSGEWEQDGFLAAPASPTALPNWLREHAAKVTLGGRAALWAEGCRRWGKEWFEANCEDRP